MLFVYLLHFMYIAASSAVVTHLVDIRYTILVLWVYVCVEEIRLYIILKWQLIHSTVNYAL